MNPIYSDFLELLNIEIFHFKSCYPTDEFFNCSSHDIWRIKPSDLPKSFSFFHARRFPGRVGLIVCSQPISFDKMYQNEIVDLSLQIWRGQFKEKEDFFDLLFDLDDSSLFHLNVIKKYLVLLN